MSVLVSCKNCNNEWEVGLGADLKDKCQECQRREERLARGGNPLTGEERAAVAQFLGIVVPEDDLPFLVTGGEGPMQWNSDGGFKDFASDRTINAVPNQVFNE